MKGKTGKLMLIWIVTLLIFGMMAISAFSGFPPRSYPGGGKGAGTIYVDPQDSNFTSTKPIDLKTGTTFDVNISIVNATFVAGWQIELTYDASILNTTSTDISYAPDMIFPLGSYSPIPATTGAYNGTHNYVLMTATTTGAVEYNATDAGLMTITFTIIADPDPGQVLSCMLYIQVEAGIYGTWLTDTDLGFDNTMTISDGYYENRNVPLPPAWLELSPTLRKMPAIEGDRIVGTSRALFSVDILINNVNAADELFFVQLTISYNSTLIQGVWISEGTFMNDAAWATHGTIDNYTAIDPGKVTWYVMLAPNATGYWDHTTWPSGDGLLATATLEVIEQYPDSDGVAPEELVASSDLNLTGVFDEFFLGHPNNMWDDPPTDPDYLPYDPPVSGQVDIYGYYWSPPAAIKIHDPEIPLIDEVVTFDGSASVGYRNDMGVLVPENLYIVEYFWDFGDDTNATMVGVGNHTITHTYTLPGDYSVTLTVTDKDDRKDTTSQMLTIVEVIDHEINWDVHTFYVETTSDTSITPVGFYQKHAFLRFTATSHIGSAFFCNITIPRELLYSSPDEWFILVDATIILPTEYVVTENVTHTTIYIPYDPGTHTILVFGVEVIPEFSTAMLPVIFLIVASLAFVIIARKYWDSSFAKNSMRPSKKP